jgi:soluble lytic murein transglycosylase
MSSIMSKKLHNQLISTTLLAPLMMATACNAQSAAPAAQAATSAATSMAAIPSRGDTVASAVSTWSTLRQSETMPFASYANFMLNNPGWPGEAALRKNAEKMLRADGESTNTVITFFNKFAPQTATAGLRYAEALAALGRNDEARTAARQAWTAGALTPEDETRFMSRFASTVSVAEHDMRMDKLLWTRSTTTAARQIAWVSDTKRTLFAARLALLMKAPDAGAKAAALSAEDRNDPGYVADRAYWLRNTGQAIAVRNLLASPRTLNKPPLQPDAWLEMLERNAEDAARDGQWQIAYNIARQVDDTYAPGTSVKDRPLSERDSYTDLVFLGGNAALNKLGRPADAVSMFQRYANAAKSAQTRSKGLYWAGRAAEAARQASANGFYEQAAQYFDSFHGQLATERMGRSIVNLTQPREVPISAAERQSFNDRSLIRALVYLGQTGRWEDQTLFVRTLSNSVKTDAEHVLATELADRVKRLDLAVMVGRNARAAGFTDYLVSAFPQIQVPSDHTSRWTMIHAISRQESQFDRLATSRVGARGLMQLMPGTARETAPRAGLSYSYNSLGDPQYNIALGSTYFGQLMNQFGGNYVLAVAAYNAGPGNVRKWLNANGDPRNGTDVMTWIEAIPLSETRNYVQRVLENAVVYDMLNPARANIRSKAPLSSYLGKSRPG